MMVGKDDLIMNNNEDDENTVVPPRTLSAPAAPSRQEAEEHAVTHLPFRSWCPFLHTRQSKEPTPQERGRS